MKTLNDILAVCLEINDMPGFNANCNFFGYLNTVSIGITFYDSGKKKIISVYESQILHSDEKQNELNELHAGLFAIKEFYVGRKVA